MTDTSSTTPAPADPTAVVALYKNFFTSKTVIANAIGLLVTFGGAFSIRWLQFTPDQVTAATEMIFGIAAAVMPIANFGLRYLTAHPVSFTASRWTAPAPTPISAAQVQPGARVFVGAAAAQEIKDATPAPAAAAPAADPKPSPPPAPAAAKPPAKPAASKSRKSTVKGS
jgi:hypothetical protein